MFDPIMSDQIDLTKNESLVQIMKQGFMMCKKHTLQLHDQIYEETMEFGPET